MQIKIVFQNKKTIDFKRSNSYLTLRSKTVQKMYISNPFKLKICITVLSVIRPCNNPVYLVYPVKQTIKLSPNKPIIDILFLFG